MSNKGSLIVFAGCMFSGKTDLLVSYLKRAPYAGHRVVMFRPKRDTRDPDGTAKSRTGSTHPAVMVETAAEILEYVRQHAFRGVLGIEEVQFFDASLFGVIDELIDRGITVVVAGLNTDFYGQPFGIVPNLMAIADEVTITKAFCRICGHPATRSQLLGEKPTEGNVQIDNGENFEPRCLGCHEPPPK